MNENRHLRKDLRAGDPMTPEQLEAIKKRADSVLDEVQDRIEELGKAVK